MECGTTVSIRKHLSNRNAEATDATDSNMPSTLGAGSRAPPRLNPVRLAVLAAAAADPVRAGMVAWLSVFGALHLMFASSAGHVVAACAACLSAIPALHHAGQLASPALSRARSSDEFPFGFARASIIAGFTTSIVIGAVMLMLIFEALECLLARSRPCGVVSILLCALNVASQCGALALDRARARGSAGRSSSAGANNVLPGMGRAPVMALVGTCSALGCVTACHVLGASWVDAVGAIAIASVSLCRVVWPILEGCAAILLQASPPHLRESLAKSVREVSTLDGVLEVTEPHFWAVGTADCVASLRVRLRNDASEPAVRASVRTLFPAATSLTVQLDKDEWLM